MKPKLIVTLPSVNNYDFIRQIVTNELVDGVRFNTAIRSMYEPAQALQMVKKLTDKANKPLYVDVTGRQLIVTRWADPLYTEIEINHKIRYNGNACIYMKNGDLYSISGVVDGNKLHIGPTPTKAIAAGQVVNIVAEDLVITGYLTERDEEYLKAAYELGINKIMASCVECKEDIIEIEDFHPDAEVYAKIESQAGSEIIFIRCYDGLVAGRENLYLNCREKPYVLEILDDILNVDSEAFCMSNFFASLEYSRNVSISDFSDLEFMSRIGYTTFVLSDRISINHYREAMRAWSDFIEDKN